MKSIPDFFILYQESISASQTFFHKKRLYLCLKEYKKIFFLIFRIKKKLWDCLTTDEINILKQRSHHSIFSSYEKKGGNWIIY